VDAGQDVFGHHVVHQVPLVRDLKHMVEPGQVLEALETAAARVPQPGAPRAWRWAELRHHPDDQGVRTLPDEVGE